MTLNHLDGVSTLWLLIFPRPRPSWHQSVRLTQLFQSKCLWTSRMLSMFFSSLWLWLIWQLRLADLTSRLEIEMTNQLTSWGKDSLLLHSLRPGWHRRDSIFVEAWRLEMVIHCHSTCRISAVLRMHLKRGSKVKKIISYWCCCTMNVALSDGSLGRTQNLKTYRLRILKLRFVHQRNLWRPFGPPQCLNLHQKRIYKLW